MLKVFLGNNKTLKSIHLSYNLIQTFEVFSQMHTNKTLKEIFLSSQAYFTEDKPFGPDKLKQIKENLSLETLHLTLGIMKTIQPLVRAFNTFPRLVDLSITNIAMTRLHYMTLDNYLISNPRLRKLALVGVGLTSDYFFYISDSLSQCPLRKLNLNSNTLRNNGANEVARVLQDSKTIKRIYLDNNEVKEEGVVSVLKSLQYNRSVVKLSCQHNKLVITRNLLALIADLVLYENKGLRVLLLGG